VSRRALTLIATSAIAASLLLPSLGASAAPSPSSLTVSVGGAAASFSGGPITGSADGSGNAPIVQCVAPACESIPLTVTAPANFPHGQVTITVTVNFTAAAGDPVGLTGLDTYLLDSGNNVIASDPTGSAPSVVVAGKQDPGNYTIEISGENGAVQTSYTGTAQATIGSASTTPNVHAGTGRVEFGPATLVSPTILGGEPQMSFERPVKGALPGLDPQRGFVDWPVSSRTNIGTLWRTTNGGDSYRQLFDPTCAERQVPNCNTGGGGDTVNRVNNYDGTLLFGDQESLAAEAMASSADHGDSFPALRQTPVTAAGTGVDRQWISSVDAPGIQAGPFDTTFTLEALFSYHVPDAGEYVSGVDTSGVVHPAAAPVIPQVGQSGPSRVDVQQGSHGSGWFYQGYRDNSGFEVGVAPLTKYQDPTAYKVQNVTGDTAEVFPWIALDTRGNLYAAWVASDGQLYYTYSLINDAKNDPTRGGVPASVWVPKQKVNIPALGSVIFPEIVAGDPGHIAIAYMGTKDWTGISDGAPQLPNTPARWNTYVSLSTDAFDATPTFDTGLVSHRYDHLGSICTSGTTCLATMGDRSLDDMLDTTIDADGRVAVVYMDNNNAFAPATASLGSQGPPFVKVAHLAEGPSMYSGHGPYHTTYPTSYRTAAAGDATWPNTASGKNLPALDIVGDGVSVSGDQLVGRIDLSEAGAAAFTRDLAAYNTQNGSSTDPSATRLQYVVRWEDGSDVYYMAAETDSSGNPTFYGGKVDASNAVNNASAAAAIAYRAQSGFAVTGEVVGHSLLLHGKMSDFKVTQGSTLLSFAAYSLAGPSDALISGQQTSSQIFTAMRTVDASRPMDAIVRAASENSIPTPGSGGSGSNPAVTPGTIATPNTTAAPAGAPWQLVGVTLAGVLGMSAVRRRRRRA